MTEASSSEVVENTQDTPVSAQKRLTPREYARAKTMWQSGDYSLGEISTQVGVSVTALSRRFKRDGVERGSNAKKVAAAVQKSIERTAAGQAEELAAFAHTFKMNALKAIDLFNKKAYTDVAQAVRDGVPVGEKLGDLKALNEASKIISQNYNTGALILGFDQEIGDEDDLPELRVSIMTENDVAELREKQRRELAEANGEMVDEDDIGLTEEELAQLDDIIEEGVEGDT